MLGEFRKYRPYRSLAQSRREVGKLREREGSGEVVWGSTIRSPDGRSGMATEAYRT